MSNNKKNKPKKNKKLKIWVILVPILILFLSCTCCSTTLVWAGANFVPHRIVGKSMEPTLLNDNYILGKKVNPDELKRGDIVVYKVNNDYDYVHRIVALPGDTVAIVDGNLYINNELESKDIYSDATKVLNVNQEYDFAGENINDSFDKIVVPGDHIFVMGDNRDLAQDSRYLGPVEFDSVVDKVVACYWNCGSSENLGK